MTVNEIIQKNRERLAIIRSPYNPITGEGSTSIPRKKVYIKDCPIEEMYLPEQFAETGFVQKLIEIGFNGYIKFILKQGISDKIRNELWTSFCQERIDYDFEYWAYSCIQISAKGKGKDIAFLLNRAQRYYLKELEKLRIAGAPIDIILCKARQWGGSTLTQLYMLWIQLIHRSNWNSAICGHIESAARNVSGMLQKAVDNMPAWATGGIRLKTNPYQGSQKTRSINTTNSRYSIGSAEKPESLRSEDISMAHLTEVGLWKETKGKKPEDLVQSIFGSILSGPYTIKVLESTAKGVGNYFHRTWLDAVEGRNNFTPVFIPWFMIDIYSKRIDPKTYNAFIATMTEYEYWLFEIGATLEAIAWYRDKSLEFKDKWRMCSEYPSTAAEAFQSTGRRIFPQKYVEQVRTATLPPCFYGEFVANDIKGKNALTNIRFEHIEPTKDLNNILWVWALPDYTEKYYDRYVVSVDIGGTSEAADFSCIKVADRLPMLEEGGLPEIVAEWHGHIEHDLLIWKAVQIAAAYGNAVLVIESNTLETEGTEGDNFDYVLDEVVEYYDNLYSRTSPEQIKQGLPVKYGFHTNPKTKPTIINFLKSAMRDFLYIERSKPTTFEMDTYELKENGKEMGAAEGCHDDYLMATAILVYVCYKWQLPRIRREFKRTQKTRIVSEASI
jgi:hypothetical protein|nr:MAG TPA: Terminase large subunit [Caudoviricetes sp.]